MARGTVGFSGVEVVEDTILESRGGAAQPGPNLPAAEEDLPHYKPVAESIEFPARGDNEGMRQLRESPAALAAVSAKPFGKIQVLAEGQVFIEATHGAKVVEPAPEDATRQTGEEQGD